MNLKLYPTKIECYDGDDGALVFTVEQFDDECVTIKMDEVLIPKEWDEIQSMVSAALNMMVLKEPVDEDC